MNGTIKEEMYVALSRALTDGDQQRAHELQEAIAEESKGGHKVVFVEAQSPDDGDDIDPVKFTHMIHRWATRLSKARRFIKRFWLECLLSLALIVTLGYAVNLHVSYGMPEWQAYSDCITRQIIADQLDTKQWNLHSMEPDGTLRDRPSTLDAIHQHSLEVSSKVCPANWGLHHVTDDEDGAVDPRKMEKVHRLLMDELVSK